MVLYFFLLTFLIMSRTKYENIFSLDTVRICLTAIVGCDFPLKNVYLDSFDILLSVTL